MAILTPSRAAPYLAEGTERDLRRQQVRGEEPGMTLSQGKGRRKVFPLCFKAHLLASRYPNQSLNVSIN